MGSLDVANRERDPYLVRRGCEMTVRELIAELSEMPQEATVLVPEAITRYGSELTGVWHEDGWIRDVIDLDRYVHLIVE